MKRKRIVLFAYMLPFIGMIAAVLLIIWFDNKKIDVNYNSENILKDEENDSIAGLEYNYYLDISPSMLGYFDVEENTMSLLANVFEEINTDNDSNFYLCNHELIDRRADDFYSYMRFSEGIDEIWRNLLIERKLAETSKKSDLNIIFSQEAEEESNNAVNIIITDMNFGTRNATEEERKENMEKFAQSLSEKNKVSNLCIYNFDSSYSGGIDSDTYKSNWKENANESEAGSFFVIFFTDSKKAYDYFLNDLEDSLKKAQVDYSKKSELKNHVFGDKHEISIDQKKFVNSDTELKDFNFDNKSFKNLPDNAVGLRFYGKKENRAFVHMDVSQYNLVADYSSIEDGEKLNCTVETAAKIYYPLNFGYQEYISDNEIIGKKNAFMEQKKGNNMLVYEMEVKKNGEFPHFPLASKYFLVDISFMMTNPGYIVPEWVSSLNIAGKKETYIEEFFQTLIENKNERYKDFVSEYERYMGSLYIFINY